MKQAKQTVNEALSLSARHLFTYLSQRERNRSALDIPLILRTFKRSNIEYDPKDMLSAFKSLESAGLGTVIYSVRGSAQRFSFKKGVSLIDVGKQGLLGNVTMRQHRITTKRVPTLRVVTPAPVVPNETIGMLKDGIYHSFVIPGSFNELDRQWLASAILRK